MTLIVALALLLQQNGAKQEKSIAARVNDEVITWDDVDIRLAKIGAETPAGDLPQARQGELKKIVQERLFLLEAKRLQIAVTETDIDGAIDRQKKNQLGRPGDTKDDIDRKFADWLRIVQRKTLAEYREQVRIELLASAVRRRLVTDSFRAPNLYSTLLTETVTPDEIRDYYEKNKDRFKPILKVYVSRIALQFNNPQQKDDQMAVAMSLKRKIEAGGDVRVLMALYSDIRPDSKSDGALILTPTESTFSPETNQLLFHELTEGAVSKIVVDKNTLNIFKLERKIDEKGDDFEQAQTKIRAELENQKQSENRKALRNELLQRYYVRPSDLFND
jgi:hypothetical protein